MSSAENHYETIVEGALDFAIISLDPNRKITTWNRGAERIFGRSRDDVLGQSASLLFTPEDQAIGEDDREFTIAATEGRADDDRWHVRADGSRLWASGVLTALRDDRGVIEGFVKVVREKTDERRLQENLRISEEQFSRLFLGNPAAIVVERRDTEAFVLANEAFFQLTGYWRAETMGRPGRELKLWAASDQRRNAMRALEPTGRSGPVRLDIRAKDGTLRECTATLATTRLAGEDAVLITLVPVIA